MLKTCFFGLNTKPDANSDKIASSSTQQHWKNPNSIQDLQWEKSKLEHTFSKSRFTILSDLIHQAQSPSGWETKKAISSDALLAGSKMTTSSQCLKIT